MIRIRDALRAKSMRGRMILQIHDELVLEAPEDELEEAKKILKEGMEGVIRLDVPLIVDIGIGKNWSEAH